MQRPDVTDDAQDHQGNDNPSPSQRRSLFFHVRFIFRAQHQEPGGSGPGPDLIHQLGI
jgi:hypothetical protein